MPETTHLLQQVEIFKDLPANLIERFAAALKPAVFAPGTEIIHKGEEGDSMYVIAKGKVKIHDGEHVIATMSEGNFFGEFSLLDSAPRSMSVTALDEVSILIIGRELFFDLLQKQPGITKKFVSALTRRLRKQNESIISQLKSREEELTRLVEERTRELKQRNEEISIKNKEITDNVNYARKIQAAILPDELKIRKGLPHSFVLYLPKDIVSGDFYAYFQHDGDSTIIAADCTGHGVTGAFLSVVGNSLLTKIINENKINAPGKVLDRLNLEIISTLNQKSDNSSDGMDIAICTLNLPGKTLRYSGANRPLWLIRDNELITYAHNKFPIGGMQILNRENFQEHKIDLKANDVFYIFSDGFADQFGGPSGKKLMTKNFKQLLLSIHALPMEEQKQRLFDHFNKWKGSLEQVDDVLVIGVRV